jgi:hypothetical protein
MAVDTRPSYQVRGASTSTFSTPYVSRRGELLQTPALPQDTTIVAQQNSWFAKTATAAAPVTAIPTTAALIGLWNGSSNKYYVMDSAFFSVVADTAAVQNLSLLGNVSVQAVLTALANTITPKPLYAGASYAGSARVAVGITLDATNGVAADWVTLGGSVGSNTVGIGCAVDVNLRGGIILPPNHQFALTVLAGASTATSVQVGFRWHEIDTLP